MPGRWRTESTSVQALMVESCWRPMVGEVAGDFHDVIDLMDGRVAIVIGDVAGMGSLAAERADELQGSLHRLLRRTADPSTALRTLDAEFGGPDALFVTLACAVVEPASRTVAVASAGHPPVLVTDGLHAELLAGTVGPPLGIADDREAVVHPLPGGAALFMYTDGLVERRNGSLEENLESLVHAGRGLRGTIASAAELTRRVTAQLGQPADDATVVSVRMLPSGTRRLFESRAIGGRPRIGLRLYVDSRDLRSVRTESVVKELALRTRETLDFLIEVIDVSQPGIDTEQDGILAAPTIVRATPEPVIRVVGSVRSADELARALQLPLSQEDDW